MVPSTGFVAGEGAVQVLTRAPRPTRRRRPHRAAAIAISPRTSPMRSWLSACARRRRRGAVPVGGAHEGVLAARGCAATGGTWWARCKRERSTSSCLRTQSRWAPMPIQCMPTEMRCLVLALNPRTVLSRSSPSPSAKSSTQPHSSQVRNAAHLGDATRIRSRSSPSSADGWPQPRRRMRDASQHAST